VANEVDPSVRCCVVVLGLKAGDMQPSLSAMICRAPAVRTRPLTRDVAGNILAQVEAPSRGRFRIRETRWKP
jgi:hypothetical protein